MGMKGYKAYKKGLICEPNGNKKQYAENTVFEEDTAEICLKGMHFCKDPLAVLDYYPLVDENGNMSEFTEVEAMDECKTDDNQKFCTKKIENKVAEMFGEIIDLIKEYEPQTEYISLSFLNGNIMGFNDYFIKNDTGIPVEKKDYGKINFFREKGK